jgi:hypothetical protein
MNFDKPRALVNIVEAAAPPGRRQRACARRPGSPGCFLPNAERRRPRCRAVLGSGARLEVRYKDGPALVAALEAARQNLGNP